MPPALAMPALDFQARAFRWTPSPQLAQWDDVAADGLASFVPAAARPGLNTAIMRAAVDERRQRDTGGLPGTGGDPNGPALTRPVLSAAKANAWIARSIAAGHDSGQSLFWDVLDAIDTPRQVLFNLVAGTFDALTGDSEAATRRFKATGKWLWNGMRFTTVLPFLADEVFGLGVTKGLGLEINEEDRLYGAQLMRGWLGENTSPWITLPLGFAMDIIGDPLMFGHYVNGVARATTKLRGAVTEAGVAAKTLEGGQIGRAASEAVRKRFLEAATAEERRAIQLAGRGGVVSDMDAALEGVAAMGLHGDKSLGALAKEQIRTRLFEEAKAGGALADMNRIIRGSDEFATLTLRSEEASNVMLSAANVQFEAASVDDLVEWAGSRYTRAEVESAKGVDATGAPAPFGESLATRRSIEADLVADHLIKRLQSATETALSGGPDAALGRKFLRSGVTAARPAEFRVGGTTLGRREARFSFPRLFGRKAKTAADLDEVLRINGLADFALNEAVGPLRTTETLGALAAKAAEKQGGAAARSVAALGLRRPLLGLPGRTLTVPAPVSWMLWPDMAFRGVADRLIAGVGPVVRTVFKLPVLKQTALAVSKMFEGAAREVESVFPGTGKLYRRLGRDNQDALRRAARAYKQIERSTGHTFTKAERQEVMLALDGAIFTDAAKRKLLAGEPLVKEDILDVWYTDAKRELRLVGPLEKGPAATRRRRLGRIRVKEGDAAAAAALKRHARALGLRVERRQAARARAIARLSEPQQLLARAVEKHWDQIRREAESWGVVLGIRPYVFRPALKDEDSLLLAPMRITVRGAETLELKGAKLAVPRVVDEVTQEVGNVPITIKEFDDLIAERMKDHGVGSIKALYFPSTTHLNEARRFVGLAPDAPLHELRDRLLPMRGKAADKVRRKLAGVFSTIVDPGGINHFETSSLHQRFNSFRDMMAAGVTPDLDAATAVTKRMLRHEQTRHMLRFNRDLFKLFDLGDARVLTSRAAALQERAQRDLFGALRDVVRKAEAVGNDDAKRQLTRMAEEVQKAVEATRAPKMPNHIRYAREVEAGTRIQRLMASANELLTRAQHELKAKNLALTQSYGLFVPMARGVVSTLELSDGAVAAFVSRLEQAGKDMPRAKPQVGEDIGRIAAFAEERNRNPNVAELLDMVVEGARFEGTRARRALARLSLRDVVAKAKAAVEAAKGKRAGLSAEESRALNRTLSNREGDLRFLEARTEAAARALQKMTEEAETNAVLRARLDRSSELFGGDVLEASLSDLRAAIAEIKKLENEIDAGQKFLELQKSPLQKDARAIAGPSLDEQLAEAQAARPGPILEAQKAAEKELAAMTAFHDSAKRLGDNVAEPARGYYADEVLALLKEDDTGRLVSKLDAEGRPLASRHSYLTTTAAGRPVQVSVWVPRVAEESFYDLVDDIGQRIRRRLGEDDVGGALSVFRKRLAVAPLARFNRFWKPMVTIYIPAFIGRNLAGGISTNYLDLGSSYSIETIRDSAGAVLARKRGIQPSIPIREDAFGQAFDAVAFSRRFDTLGGAGGGTSQRLDVNFVPPELLDGPFGKAYELDARAAPGPLQTQTVAGQAAAANPTVRDRFMSGLSALASYPWKNARAVWDGYKNFMVGIQDDVEHFLRLSNAMGWAKRGVPWDEAIERSLRAQVDYGDFGFWGREAMVHLFPFGRFFKGNIQHQLENLVNQPHRLIALERFLRGDESPGEKERRVGAILSRDEMFGIGRRDSKGRLALDRGLGFPVSDLAQMMVARPMSFFAEIMSRSHPLPTTAIEVMGNYSFYFEDERRPEVGRSIELMPDAIQEFVEYHRLPNGERVVNPRKLALVRFLGGRFLQTALTLTGGRGLTTFEGLKRLTIGARRSRIPTEEDLQALFQDGLGGAD